MRVFGFTHRLLLSSLLRIKYKGDPDYRFIQASELSDKRGKKVVGVDVQDGMENKIEELVPAKITSNLLQEHGFEITEDGALRHARIKLSPYLTLVLLDLGDAWLPQIEQANMGADNPECRIMLRRMRWFFEIQQLYLLLANRFLSNGKQKPQPNHNPNP